MRALLGVMGVIAVALLFILGGAIIVRNFDNVVSDVRQTLAFVPPPEPDLLGSMEGVSSVFTTEHEPLSDTERGIQRALLTMLVGGIPVAVLGLVLAHRSDIAHKRWAGWWAQVFLAGFVFQLGSLFIASLFLFMLVLTSNGGALLVGDLHSLIVTAVMLLTMVSSVVALRAWRSLRASVSQEPLTLT